MSASNISLTQAQLLLHKQVANRRLARSDCHAAACRYAYIAPCAPQWQCLVLPARTGRSADPLIQQENAAHLHSAYKHARGQRISAASVATNRAVGLAYDGKKAVRSGQARSVADARCSLPLRKATRHTKTALRWPPTVAV